MKPAPDNRLRYKLRMMRTWVRLRNFRGHNVHSPFAYGLIRQAIVPRQTDGGDRGLFDTARAEGLPRKAAVQLQNLQRHCPGHRIVLTPAGENPQPVTQPDRTIHCILHPRLTRQRLQQCRTLVDAHNGMSIDNRRYILLFHDSRLAKKHYKL